MKQLLRQLAEALSAATIAHLTAELAEVKECVAGCGVLPVVAEWRDIPAIVAEVKDMHRRGEI